MKYILKLQICKVNTEKFINRKSSTWIIFLPAKATSLIINEIRVMNNMFLQLTKTSV